VKKSGILRSMSMERSGQIHSRGGQIHSRSDKNVNFLTFSVVCASRKEKLIFEHSLDRQSVHYDHPKPRALEDLQL
jgi:hypothetical protein